MLLIQLPMLSVILCKNNNFSGAIWPHKNTNIDGQEHISMHCVAIRDELVTEATEIQHRWPIITPGQQG